MLRESIADWNHDARIDLLTRGAVGLLFTGAAFGVLFFGAWVFLVCGGVIHRFDFGLRHATALVALATLVYFAVAFWTAWRGIDPLDLYLAEQTPPTEEELRARRRDEAAAALLTLATGGLQPQSDTMVGCAWALVAGPAGLIDAWRAFRRRIPESEALLAAGETLLERAVAGEAALEPSSETQMRAAIALHRLGLVDVRPAEDDQGIAVIATARGRRVAG